VLVEATEPTTTIPAHEPWEPILLDAGYVFAAFDGLNRWYVRKEDAELTEVVRVPANTLDDYAPYEHVKLQMDLQASVEQLRVLLDESTGREAAARAVNQSLLLDIAGFAHETSALRSAYERLERALTSTRARLEELREQLAASEAGARDLERHLDAARAQLSDQMAPPAADPLPEGVSPTSLAVARRLTAMAARHPVVAERIKVGLRAGLRMKRRIRPG
jgi:chromosome segregation ATPase